MAREYKQGVKVAVAGTVATFTCPEGHTSRRDYSKGPAAKRISASGLQMMARWWNDRITYVCQKCNPQAARR